MRGWPLTCYLSRMADASQADGVFFRNAAAPRQARGWRRRQRRNPVGAQSARGNGAPGSLRALTETVSGPCKSQAGASTAAGVRTDARRVFCTDCKSKQGIVAKYVSLQRAPHALDIARILRALSRMRA